MAASPLILVTGQPGVGKTTFSAMLGEALATSVINSGEALREHLARSGIAVQNRLDTGRVFIDSFGEGFVGDVIVQMADRHGAGIVEGLRLVSSLRRIRELRGRCPLIFVAARESIRRRRFLAREVHAGREHAASEMLEGKDAYHDDVEQFKAFADVVVSNNGSLKSLAIRARAVAAQLSQAASGGSLVGSADNP